MTTLSRTITMPQLGETVTEGTITRWLKNVGDVIEKYEAFAEVATDKVNAEIPSPVAGTLLEIFVKEGETVPTGAAIANIGLAAAAESSVAPEMPENASAGHATTAIAASPPVGNVDGADRLDIVPAHADPAFGAGLRLSPAVRRALREFRIDPHSVSGTGHEGRITLQDVQSAASAHAGSAAPPQGAARTPQQAGASGGGTVGRTPASSPGAASASGIVFAVNAAADRAPLRIPLTRARKTIADHMTHAVQTIPHAWTTIEVDVTSLVHKRHSEREKARAEYGFLPTYFQYFSYTVVAALARHPMMNARYGNDGIDIFPYIDLSFAIALNGNLVVPVIRNANAMSFGEFAKAMAGVTERARTGHLSIDELGGGTITVNNTGANGSILSQPIINNGQAAIVTMESIVKRPVVVDGDAIAIRSMVNICCTIDHRLIDGDVVGGFLRDLKHHLTELA